MCERDSDSQDVSHRICPKEIVETHGHEILLYAMRLATFLPVDAEEIFQETFFELLKILDSNSGFFNDWEHVSRWLFCVAGNKAREMVRKRKRRRAGDQAQGTFGAPDDWTANIPDASHDDLNALGLPVVSFKQLCGCARPPLTDRQKDWVKRCYWEGEALADIAARANCSVATVWREIHAARNKMRAGYVREFLQE